MDSQLDAAAQALASGDVLVALDLVGRREDPPGLALRGIVMARLGELDRARELLRAASRGFGPREALARARCVTAAAEIALASRDLGGSFAPLFAARRTLEARGDRSNALFAGCVLVRRLLLLGRVAEAEAALASIDTAGAPDVLAAVTHLLHADVALRRTRCAAAETALSHAEIAARRTGVDALLAEIRHAREALTRPAARRIGPAEDRPLRLAEVEALRASDVLLVDACRRAVTRRRTVVPLLRRPVLLALARALAEAWPGDASRATLVARAFGVRRPNESHRARLRVEIGRLRRCLRALAEIDATAIGFVIRPVDAVPIVALAPPLDDPNAAVLALLADGSTWSSSALALALGASQRTCQRALAALEQAGTIRAVGRARAARWVAAPISGITTVLLLPTAVAAD